MSKWRCTRCKRDPYEEGCGSPYPGQGLGCPLDYKSWWRRLLFRLGIMT